MGQWTRRVQHLLICDPADQQNGGRWLGVRGLVRGSLLLDGWGEQAQPPFVGLPKIHRCRVRAQLRALPDHLPVAGRGGGGGGGAAPQPAAAALVRVLIGGRIHQYYWRRHFSRPGANCCRRAVLHASPLPSVGLLDVLAGSSLHIETIEQTLPACVRPVFRQRSCSLPALACAPTCYKTCICVCTVYGVYVRQIVLQATTPRLQRRGLGRLLTRCVMRAAVQEGHQVSGRAGGWVGGWVDGWVGGWVGPGVGGAGSGGGEWWWGAVETGGNEAIVVVVVGGVLVPEPIENVPSGIRASSGWVTCLHRMY